MMDFSQKPKHDHSHTVIHNRAQRHRYYIRRVRVDKTSVDMHTHKTVKAAVEEVLSYLDNFSIGLMRYSQEVISQARGNFLLEHPRPTLMQAIHFADSVFQNYLDRG